MNGGLTRLPLGRERVFRADHLRCCTLAAMTHAALGSVAHRPWDLPARPWTWRQSWRDLLFAHFPVPAAVLRRHVPPPLTVQEFDGTSWVGVVPFRMTGVMRRHLPDLPMISAFPELNVRLYVEHGGKPGVWFLSLDATNRLAVWAARRFFHLPYFNARIGIAERDGAIRYSAMRHDGRAALEASYSPASPVYQSQPGTLDHWLTERYCLYARAPDGTMFRNDVHHAPWPLQRATASIDVNTYLQAHGLSVDAAPATLHFARRLDVIVWGGERLDSGRA